MRLHWFPVLMMCAHHCYIPFCSAFLEFGLTSVCVHSPRHPPPSNTSSLHCLSLATPTSVILQNCGQSFSVHSLRCISLQFEANQTILKIWSDFIFGHSYLRYSSKLWSITQRTFIPLHFACLIRFQYRCHLYQSFLWTVRKNIKWEKK